MSVAVGYVTFDCADTLKMAAFRSAVLGYQNKGGDENWAEITPTAGTGVPMLFQHVPEGKRAKNRVHLDLNASEVRLTDCKRPDYTTGDCSAAPTMGQRDRTDVSTQR